MNQEKIEKLKSKEILTFEIISEILKSHNENCVKEKVGYYTDLESLVEKVRSSKSWTMGEVFVYAEATDSFIIMKQIAPASCEMLTISPKGQEDVLTAYRYGQEELTKQLQGYLDNAPKKPATKLVRITLTAFTRMEYAEVMEVPADITQAELDNIINERYDRVDGGDYSEDPDYWRRGQCFAETEDKAVSEPTMMAWRTPKGMHIERKDA